MMDAPQREDEAGDDESLEYEFDIDEPVEKVWRALTIREIALAWMLPDENDADEREVDCQLVHVEPRRSVTYRWQRDAEEESFVTFELTPLRSGTRLRLTHGPALEIRGPVAMLMAA
jgi:uncharacterized protein YndB with AHSA1/START domain